MEDSRKSNKITEIVKLQLILKKWRRLAKNSSKSSKNSNNNSGNKSIKFLKRTLSFTNSSSVQAGGGGVSGDMVPKGYLAVCVGEELKRFIIPTEYLGHPAFAFLLSEAEEEFGFEQEGILRIPCDVALFENILKVIEKKHKDTFWFSGGDESSLAYCSSESSQLLSQPQHHPQSPMCR